MNQRFGIMVAGSAIATVLLNPTVVLAHHAMGGTLPSTTIEGFISGLAHPVIGLDHFLFVIAAGLLAVVMNRVNRGLIIPVGFILTSLMGTGVHLLGIDLPLPEVVVSASVVLFGGLLAMRHQPKHVLVSALALVAGLFHGYAYGEAIVGAETSPLVAYMMGFGMVQLAIALGTYILGNALFHRPTTTRHAFKSLRFSPPFVLRFVGFVIFGMGTALFATALIETITPV